MNVNNAFSESSALWNNTSPGAAGITLGNYNGTNKDDIDFIAYLWHDVLILQKFGTFTGNGNAEWTLRRIRFPSRTALVKNATDSSSAADWVIYDVRRKK